MILVVACGHPGAVDLIDSHAGRDADPVHLPAAEWQEFLAAVKAGKYDDLAGSPDSWVCGTPAAGPGSPGPAGPALQDGLR